MVPYSMFGQSLRLFFIKHLPVSLVFFQYFPFSLLLGLLRVDHDPSNEVFRFWFGMGYILRS
jgi:hypothetical protein